MQRIMSMGIDIFNILLIRPLCHTLSKAFFSCKESYIVRRFLVDLYHSEILLVWS